MIPKILSAALGVAVAGTFVTAAPALADTPPAAVSAATAASTAAATQPVSPARQAAAVAYAGDLVRAWGRGATRVVDAYATPAVAATLLHHANPGGPHWAQTSWHTIGRTTYVSFVDAPEHEALVLGVNDLRLGEAVSHDVTIARFVALPAQTTATGYADMLIRAWGRGDRAEADLLATPTVAAQLFAYANPGGKDWTRTVVSGTAGTIYVTYENALRHETLTVGVNDTIPLTGAEHAVYRAQFAAMG